MIKVIKSQYFWLSLTLLLGLVVRLYQIDSPIADWHSWRQADTAAVTRNFIKEGFNPFIPRYDDMSGNAESPIPNPGRFRFVEFPIYNLAVYPLYLSFGINETYHRMVSVIFSLGSIVFLYLITRKYTNIITAHLTAFTFAFLPFNVFFSRTTLPEPTFVFFALGMVYFLDRWIWESRSIWGIWGAFFTSIAFLIKPWALFFYLPLLYLLYLKKSNFLTFNFLLLTFFALSPFLFWRLWILQQPEGIPASSWLLNSDGIRFRPAFFWWIISERLGREILSVSGLSLFILGTIVRPKDGNYFLHFWLLSSLLFMVIFATGNVRHDYYQILFVPIGSIFLAKGFVWLLHGENALIPRFYLIPLGLLLFLTTFYFGYKQIKDFYRINNPSIIEVGKVADSILPENSLVVAPYNGDSAFLYQTNRPGFSFVPTSIKDLIADYGVHYYISTTYDDKTNWVLKYFQPVFQSPMFVIADLTKIKKSFNNFDTEP